MPEHNVVFAFGPGNAVFFEIDGNSYRHNLPDELEEIYKKRDARAKNAGALKRTVSLALGIDNRFALVYETTGSWYDFESCGCPTEFRDIALDQITHESTSFSFRSDKDTYFISGTDVEVEAYRYRWRGVPWTAEGALQERVAIAAESDLQYRLTFGAEDSYLLYGVLAEDRYPDDSSGIPDTLRCKMDLYKGLNDAVIVLNPFVDGQYFAYFGRGATMVWNLDRHHTEGIERVVKGFYESRSEGRSYKMVMDDGPVEVRKEE